MAENNDYGCKVCGKHFEEEEDLKSHGKDDHPEVNEAYPDLFDKKEEQREVPKEAEEIDWDEVPESDWDDVVLKKVNGEPEEEEGPDTVGEEIDQQVDKPAQSHDDWVKELEGMKDEFSEEGGTGSGPQGGGTALLPEQSAMKNINPDYDPFKATPKSQLMQTDPYITRTTEEAPEPSDTAGSTPDYEGDWQDKLVWNSETHHYEKADEEEGCKEKEEAQEEEGGCKEKAKEDGDSSGADDPLAKVADLAESYRYMSKDHRASLFESVKFTQGDSAILAGLEWNELTRPVKVEASEAYIKEQEETEEEDEEIKEDEEDKAYENLYNLEKYHSSPDYKKKAIACTSCNESFYNANDKAVHFNEVHATEQEYKLPETCPYCNIEIHEPDNLDWHMQEEHGAHVPSQYTQTGLQGAMADTDFDSLESHKKGNENELDLCPICQDGMKCEDLISHAPKWNTTNNWSTNGIEPPNANESRSASDLREEIKKQENFINLASHENPMNMGDAQNKLDGLRSELESLGGEDLGATEDEEGWGDNWGSPEETEKDLYDLTHPEGDKDEAEEEEPVEKWDKDDDIGRNYAEPTGDDEPLDDDSYWQGRMEEAEEEEDKLVIDNDEDLYDLHSRIMDKIEVPDRYKEAEEQKVECESCGEEFDSSQDLEEHQYAYYHGKYEDEGEGEDMPRNVMGG